MKHYTYIAFTYFRYTACHVHKSVNEEFKINEQLQDQEYLFPTHPFWKNYSLFRETGEKLHFNKSGDFLYYKVRLIILKYTHILASSIHSYDVRSQYPSAALPPNPVGKT